MLWWLVGTITLNEMTFVWWGTIPHFHEVVACNKTVHDFAKFVSGLLNVLPFLYFFNSHVQNKFKNCTTMSIQIFDKLGHGKGALKCTTTSSNINPLINVRLWTCHEEVSIANHKQGADGHQQGAI